jgi:hypothetical protein
MHTTCLKLRCCASGHKAVLSMRLPDNRLSLKCGGLDQKQDDPRTSHGSLRFVFLPLSHGVVNMEGKLSGVNQCDNGPFACDVGLL